MKIQKLSNLAVALTSLLALGACGANGPGTVSLSVGSAGSGGGSSALSITAGADTLTITKAEVVLRKIELENETASCSTSGPGRGCMELETGPVLLALPLDGSVSTVVEVPVVPGTYDKVEFKIHKVSDDASEEAFLAAHPELAGKSIRVEGTFNGQPFVFTSSLEAEQEVRLANPIVVDAGGASANLTLLVNLNTWFVAADGALIAPETANAGGINEERVRDNIRASLQAFGDDDRDGHDDHEQELGDDHGAHDGGIDDHGGSGGTDGGVDDDGGTSSGSGH